jgi:hypothetical protein
MSLPPNKIRVSFELDLTNFNGFRPDDKEDLSGSIQNLGSFFANLKGYYLDQSFLWASKREEETEYSPSSEQMVTHYREQADLAEQIFDNYKLEGTLQDGTEFVFTHKEPGYHEELLYFNEPSELTNACKEIDIPEPEMAVVPDDADIEWWINDQISFMDEKSKQNILEVKSQQAMSRFNGMGIRNYYGLWQKNGLTKYFNEQLGVWHADDMSGILLEALWHRVHGTIYDPFPTVERYKTHWAKSGTNMKGEKIVTA